MKDFVTTDNAENCGIGMKDVKNFKAKQEYYEYIEVWREHWIFMAAWDNIEKKSLIILIILKKKLKRIV